MKEGLTPEYKLQRLIKSLREKKATPVKLDDFIEKIWKLNSQNCTMDKFLIPEQIKTKGECEEKCLK